MDSTDHRLTVAQKKIGEYVLTSYGTTILINCIADSWKMLSQLLLLTSAAPDDSTVL